MSLIVYEYMLSCFFAYLFTPLRESCFKNMQNLLAS
jgi:hypothetical protein